MAKRNLYLHIGTGKTGTTAIQTFCNINNKKLHSVGYHYMQSILWSDNSHHLLGFVLWGQDIFDVPEIKNLSTNELFAQMEEEIGNLPLSIENIIISSELLFVLAGQKKINPLLDFIKKNFNSTTIITYLRRQDHHIQSEYLQRIKTNNDSVKGKSIQEFAANFTGDFYYEKLQPWSEFFGKKNIKVRVYEKQQYHGESIFSDFLYALQLEMDPGFILPPVQKTNLSLSVEAYEILKACPEIDPMNLSDLGLSIYNSAAFSNLELLSPVEKNKIIDAHKETNKKVAKEYLNRKNGILFYEELPDKKNNTHYELTVEKLLPLLMRMLKFQNKKSDTLGSKVLETDNTILKMNVQNDKLIDLHKEASVQLNLILTQQNKIALDLMSENKSLKNENSELERKNTDTNKINDQLKTLVDELKKSQIQLDSEKKEADKKFDELKKNYNELNEQKTLLLETNNQQQMLIARINNETKELLQQKDLMVDSLNLSATKITELNALINKKDEQTSELNNIITKLNEKVKKFENDYENKNIFQIAYNRIINRAK